MSRRVLLLGTAAVAAVVAVVAAWAAWTAPTRGAVRAYTALLVAANRADVSAAEALCTARYRAAHDLRPAPDGGLVGLPRNIHKNFQVWREGPDVWLCPTNRVGPIYRFVREADGWKFDGPVGILLPHGRVAPMVEGAEDDDAP